MAEISSSLFDFLTARKLNELTTESIIPKITEATTIMIRRLPAARRIVCFILYSAYRTPANILPTLLKNFPKNFVTGL